MSLPTIETECQLLDWSETAKGGIKIVLQLPDESALEPFRSMTLAKRGIAGQRLAAVFVELGDDEQPVPKPKGGPLSKLCGQWCSDARFQAWLEAKEPNTWALYARDDGSARERTAAEVVRQVCDVDSRAELDNDPEAAKRFHELVRDPYRLHLQEHGE